MSKNRFIDEMTWRNMVHDHTPGLNEQLNLEMTSAYIGFDPTADSIHIGSLSTLMLLKHFQLAGHKPYILVGGATGMVGDPSGKSEERKLLSVELINHNISKMKKELSSILDFDSGKNAAEIVNNHDWFKNYSLLPFLRDIGKHITINYMMAKDSVKTRLEAGLSFTEFSYQLVQGYDFLHLLKHHNVKLQMGGSDQWGNITTGTELIRRVLGKQAFALTAPLVTKSDGKKFGKSESGNIWLSPKKTSPYKFYQFWLNTADDEVETLLKRFTLLKKEEITELSQQHQEEPHRRIMQKKLAEEVTALIHGKENLNTACKASNILFGKSVYDDLLLLDEKTFLDVFEGVPQISITNEQYNNSDDIISLLSDMTNNEIFKSKGEARRLIKGGGVSINKLKIAESSSKKEISLIQSKYILVQKGKKHYFIIHVIP